ncbi:MAG: hypothetical protein ABI461_08315 [Polyangiaceae bacterium]
MASFPEPPPPPRVQVDYSQRDEEPLALRPDHYDHDTAFARSKYAELAPKKPEQIKLPRWMVLSLFLLVILIVLSFTGSTFQQIVK